MDDQTAPVPDAVVRPAGRRHFQVIWLLPLIAGAIALYLVWNTLSQRGPEITISFRSGDGIVAGQTKVRHKAVELGTVRSVTLTSDLNAVDVHVDMNRFSERTLSDSARFWVVRPRLSAGTISGLDTVLSGSYIELDPGTASGPRQTHFTGLDDPPAVRTGEPGLGVTLKADRVGSIGVGAPVFYRDLPVGEVLSLDGTHEGEGVTIHAFIHAPYDQFVHPSTHFWNASGVSIDLGSQGVQLRLESIQAVLSGGVAFDTADDRHALPVVAQDTLFPLFPSETASKNAAYTEQIKVVTFFEGSVRGLSVGAGVELYGIQIGTVTGIHLELDPAGKSSHVAVHMEVQPGRFMSAEATHANKPLDTARTLVGRGLRAQLRSANLITGQSIVAFDFIPDAPPAEVTEQGDEIVLPNVPGGLDSITANLSAVAQKLGALPLEQISANLNNALQGLAQLVGGPELKQSLGSLTGTLNAAQAVVGKLDASVGPMLKGLQSTVDHAQRLVASADHGYGADSPFNRDLQRVLAQLSETARSIRLLADYLDQHPEALVRGRTGRSGER